MLLEKSMKPPQSLKTGGTMYRCCFTGKEDAESFARQISSEFGVKSSELRNDKT